MSTTLVKAAGRWLLAPAISLALTAAASAGAGPAAAGAQVLTFHPSVTDWQLVATGTTPPAQSDCNAIGRRCFNPLAEETSYNLLPLYAQGHKGQGETIAIVDSFGAETMPHDLAVFNTAFGLPHMCGEEGMPAPTSCPTGTPTFTEMQQGNVNTNPQPPNHGTRQESHNVWALEVALDVEWAHSMAPLANILLVTTPTAETLGVQGFPDFMKAEQTVIDNHMASVISQSFASAEEAFNSTQSLLNLRFAFQDALANHVTVLASSGDSGTANIMKTPVKNPTTIPFPTVQWPASDPLVTGVGGTYECTNATTGLGVDSVSPPGACQAHPGVREVGWIGSGGGFSHVFTRPSFQDTLPAGSTPIGSMRGVPDVALQASSRTGVLIYSTNPNISTNVKDLGWFVIGGTSSSSPQWAGLIAVANEMNGHHALGYINPALYTIASNPAKYAADFYDVTTGANQTDPSIPGFSATTGWDPVTGLGTPNAAKLLPDLIAQVNGS
jgi:subtilase family serine protease